LPPPQELQAELGVGRADAAADRRAIEAPHEDTLDALTDEQRRLRFARDLVLPLQAASEGVLARTAARTVTQVEAARQQGAYETLLGERAALQERLGSTEEQLLLTEAGDGGAEYVDDGGAINHGDTQQERAQRLLAAETTRLRAVVERRQAERTLLEQRLRAATAAVGGAAGVAEAAAFEAQWTLLATAHLTALREEAADREAEARSLRAERDALTERVRTLWKTLFLPREERVEFERQTATVEREGGDRAVVQMLRTEADRLACESSEPDLKERQHQRLVQQFTAADDDVLGALRLVQMVRKIQAKVRAHQAKRYYAELKLQLNTGLEMHRRLGRSDAEWDAYLDYIRRVSADTPTPLSTMLELATVKMHSLQGQLLVAATAAAAAGASKARSVATLERLGSLVAERLVRAGVDVGALSKAIQAEVARTGDETPTEGKRRSGRVKSSKSLSRQRSTSDVANGDAQPY
jgi:hypothetical protein